MQQLKQENEGMLKSLTDAFELLQQVKGRLTVY